MNNNFKIEYSQIQADNVKTIYLKDNQKNFFELKMQFFENFGLNIHNYKRNCCLNNLNACIQDIYSRSEIFT